MATLWRSFSVRQTSLDVQVFCAMGRAMGGWPAVSMLWDGARAIPVLKMLWQMYR